MIMYRQGELIRGIMLWTLKKIWDLALAVEQDLEGAKKTETVFWVGHWGMTQLIAEKDA